MKKIFKLSALLSAAALLLAAVGCQKELVTAQYDDNAVTLASFGPNPVMRGAQLRFFGSNLDKVTKVEVPGIDAITSIEVVAAGKVSEIRVTLPVEGPEIGRVKLYAGSQVLTTKSDVTYSEPIVFEGFEAPETVFPGDVITLKGDYMQLVKAVIFAGGEEVAVMESSTRHEAKVTVPANALSGKIILSDKGNVENLFYSEKEIKMGKPTVKAAAKASTKPGDAITVKGAHLEMIEAVTFEGGVDAEFELAEDNSSIVVTVPATAADGIFNAISFEGDAYEAGEIEAIMPTELSAAPAPVKAGATLTVSGKDLDVVTAMAFEGAEVDSFLYVDGDLTVTVPAKAKDGDLVLSIANGKAASVAIELVKPAVTAIAPVELYAGDDITITGTDLDLIVKATLGGKEVEIVDEDGEPGEDPGEIEGTSVLMATKRTDTELILRTNASSVSGKLVLTLENGTTVEPEQEISMNYHSLVIVNEIPASQHIGQEVVIKGEKLNLVETIYIGEAKVTNYSIRTDNEIRFLMPWNKVGSYTVSFHLYNGDVEDQPTAIEVLLEQTFTTIWEGEEHLAWSGMQTLAWGGYDWSKVKAGATLVAYFTLDSDFEWWQVRFGNGSWKALPSTAGLGTDGNIPMSAGQTYYALTLTDADIAALTNEGGLVMTGTNYTLTKLVLVGDIPQEISVLANCFDTADGMPEIKFPLAMSWSHGGRFRLLRKGAIDLASQNWTAGESIMTIYKTGTGQAQINNPNWSPFTTLADWEGGNDVLVLTLTQDMIDCLTGAAGDGWSETAFIIQGDGMTITDVTFLP